MKRSWSFQSVLIKTSVVGSFCWKNVNCCTVLYWGMSFVFFFCNKAGVACGARTTTRLASIMCSLSLSDSTKVSLSRDISRERFFHKSPWRGDGSRHRLRNAWITSTKALLNKSVLFLLFELLSCWKVWWQFYFCTDEGNVPKLVSQLVILSIYK